ncbi:MAG: hypothetical protein WBL25_05830 [Anaerolineales bacterium]
MKARIISIPCKNQDYRNSATRVVDLCNFCKLDKAGDNLVRQAMSQLNLSARSHHRVLKLARTIADLAGSEGILRFIFSTL